MLLAVPALAVAGAAATEAEMTTASGGGTVLQVNLVSDVPGTGVVLDPNLVNPWGIAASPTGPFWVSNAGSSLATFYQVPGSGTTAAAVYPLAVKIPTPVSLTGARPTGTVYNTGMAGGAFLVTGPNSSGQTASAPAQFLVATADGTIVGWDPGIDPSHQFSGTGGQSAAGVIAVDNSGNNFTSPSPATQTGAVYKGLAIATDSTPIVTVIPTSTSLLYAANFRAGAVEVYDPQFTRVTSLPAGAFADPALPAGYAPFNVQVLNGKVYVTYALQDATSHNDVPGPGHGFVDVFNLDGTPGLAGGQARLLSGGSLNSPWGMAMAPPNFAGIQAPGNDPVLLVGNSGDGFIHAFDPPSGSSLGQLNSPAGAPVQISGLWDLEFGNGGTGGAANTLYFAAGINDEADGLFGSLPTA